jgi:hypothetical protein
MLNKLKSKKFWECAIARCIRTVCQTALATLTTGVVLTDINWVLVASSSALSGIVSILMSIVMGIPESEE